MPIDSSPHNRARVAPLRLPHRDRWLDLLRGFAVIGVVGAHLRPLPESTYSPLLSAVGIWRHGGWVGVDAFFVLSGYLVSGLLFTEAKSRNRLNVGRFLIRRAFKIYPPFWITVLLVLLARYLLNSPVTAQSVIGELLFLQNYVGKISGTHWTLAVEEHFYLLLAFWMATCFFTFKRKAPDALLRFPSVPWVSILTMVTCFYFRTLDWEREDYWQQVMKTHLRMDSLMFGVLLSWSRHFGPLAGINFGNLASFFLFIAGIACFIPAFSLPYISGWFMAVPSYNLFFLGGGFLILAGTKVQISNPVLKGIAGIGGYSYCIYLCHDPWQRYFVLRIVDPTDSTLAWWAYFLLYTVGALVGGIVMSLIIEKPALRLRDRFFPSQSSLTGLPSPPSDRAP